MIDRKTLFAVIAAAAVGYWLAGSSSSTPPAPDRPVLRWIARAAKSLLWVALVAEKPPVDQAAERRLVHAPPVGDDGYQLLDHGKGW
jgi:hypothetical protein